MCGWILDDSLSPGPHITDWFRLTLPIRFGQGGCDQQCRVSATNQTLTHILKCVPSLWLGFSLSSLFCILGLCVSLGFKHFPNLRERFLYLLRSMLVYMQVLTLLKWRRMLSGNYTVYTQTQPYHDTRIKSANTRLYHFHDTRQVHE